MLADCTDRYVRKACQKLINAAVRTSAELVLLSLETKELREKAKKLDREEKREEREWNRALLQLYDEVGVERLRIGPDEFTRLEEIYAENQLNAEESESSEDNDDYGAAEADGGDSEEDNDGNRDEDDEEEEEEEDFRPRELRPGVFFQYQPPSDRTASDREQAREAAEWEPEFEGRQRAGRAERRAAAATARTMAATAEAETVVVAARGVATATTKAKDEADVKLQRTRGGRILKRPARFET